MIRKSMPPPIEAAEGLIEEAAPAFRSSAVARMAQMPVATLRIWEQRYQAVRPGTAPSGHRLYSAADVQRVMLLRQLTDQGHAIGATAGLSTAQLQALAAQQLQAQQSSPAAGGSKGKPARPGAAALRVVVVGHALAARLQRPAVAQSLGQPLKLLAVFESLEEAAAHAPEVACDLLICHWPALPAEVLPAIKLAQQVCPAARFAVVYRFAGAAAKRTLAEAGATLLREPPEDEDLGQWLGALQASIEAKSADLAPTLVPAISSKALLADGVSAPPRRFDDAALTAIAGLSPTLACECPRHIAELLMQLSSFEAYSAACINRSPADAELHAYLHRVAGASRAMFEAAMVTLAEHEGLSLP
ncbi:MAG: MerR family transcriptional regulator [Burkholderiaceae bacterium]|nr:MerR family transcriptional regulator [Burkholderiaceae bacterium]